MSETWVILAASSGENAEGTGGGALGTEITGGSAGRWQPVAKTITMRQSHDICIDRMTVDLRKVTKWNKQSPGKDEHARHQCGYCIEIRKEHDPRLRLPR